jgi:hypothetical protein
MKSAERVAGPVRPTSLEGSSTGHHWLDGVSVAIIGCWLALDRSVFMIGANFAHNHGQLDTIFGPFARNDSPACASGSS